ncbi:three component ABC system middle component [Roseococcus sp. YIM B11640]|uniref:three component ABC system middle component n=1 Tax=Roseococcus sp. YIM B11640 TaxID=3133973 RepID=UPI003C7ED8A7
MALGTRWEIAWNKRPREEAALLNPAFSGELIFRATHEYVHAKDAPFALPLAFLVLPLVMHAATRESLPRRANAAMAGWMAENGPVLALVASRTLQLRPISREALMFVIRVNALAISEGGLAVGERPLRAASRASATTPETDAMRRSAALVGRWFAQQPSPGSVLQSMGVEP